MVNTGYPSETALVQERRGPDSPTVGSLGPRQQAPPRHVQIGQSAWDHCAITASPLSTDRRSRLAGKHAPLRLPLHIFTDISLTGNSAALIVLFPRYNKPQLLMLDAAKAWDLVFPDAESFNVWAEERYRQPVNALRSAMMKLDDDLFTAI